MNEKIFAGGATDARKIVEKHRLHVEASPGVGEEVQGYALAVCDDILFDLDHQTPVSEIAAPKYAPSANWNGATIFEAVARGWCSPENSHKEFDATLGEAIAKEVIEALAGEAPLSARAKFIRCVWVAEREFGYGKALRIVDSDHPRFTIGTRFDFGFLDIAVSEGYQIQIEPVPPAVQHDIEEARRERQAARR